MMRQPPEYVPSDNAPAARMITHQGTSKPVWYPPTTSARTITPIVFWASCSPCPSAIDDAETVWASRKPRTTRCGFRDRKIHKMAFALLKRKSKKLAAKYHLKRAIMELGPTGFPFEQYVAALLKSQGYSVRTGVIAQGVCVNHEVDIIAEKENTVEIYECKYHNHLGIFCDVKVPLYVRSRFVDVEQMMDKASGKKYFGGVATNTKFSHDAIRYGSCIGLKLLSWDYPDGKAIKDLADTLALYPVTCMTSLTKTEKAHLLAKDVVVCQQVLENKKLLDGLELTESRYAAVLEELQQICRSSS